MSNCAIGMEQLLKLKHMHTRLAYRIWIRRNSDGIEWKRLRIWNMDANTHQLNFKCDVGAGRTIGENSGEYLVPYGSRNWEKCYFFYRFIIFANTTYNFCASLIAKQDIVHWQSATQNVRIWNDFEALILRLHILIKARFPFPRTSNPNWFLKRKQTAEVAIYGRFMMQLNFNFRCTNKLLKTGLKLSQRGRKQ